MRSKWYYGIGLIGILSLAGGCETAEKVYTIQNETVAEADMEQEIFSEAILQEPDPPEVPIEIIEVEEPEDVVAEEKKEGGSYEAAVRFIEEQDYTDLAGQKIGNYYVKQDLDGYLIPAVNVPDLSDGWISAVLQDVDDDGTEELLFITLEGGTEVVLHLCKWEGETYREQDRISTDFQSDAGRLSCDIFRYSAGGEISYFIEHQWSYDYIADGVVWDLYEVRVGEGRLMAEARYNTSGSDINSSMTQYLDYDWEEITAIKEALRAYGFRMDDFWGHNRIVVQDQSAEKICSIIISSDMDYEEFSNFMDDDSREKMDSIEIEFIDYMK